MRLAHHLLKHQRFDRLIAVRYKRWCLSYKLSYRDLVEMMADRGLVLARTTIIRWMLKLTRTTEQCWRPNPCSGRARNAKHSILRRKNRRRNCWL